MPKLGDSIVCRVKDSAIVSIYEDTWQDELVLDIVAAYEQGYLLYVPQNLFLNDSVKITKENRKKFNVDKRFIDSVVYYVTEHQIIRTHNKMDGMRCSKCDDFIPMSEANQPDGTLVCWQCTNYRQWK